MLIRYGYATGNFSERSRFIPLDIQYPATSWSFAIQILNPTTPECSEFPIRFHTRTFDLKAGYPRLSSRWFFKFLKSKGRQTNWAV